MEEDIEVKAGKFTYGFIKAFFRDLWNNREELGNEGKELIEEIDDAEGEEEKREKVSQSLKQKPVALEQIQNFISNRTLVKVSDTLARVNEGSEKYEKLFRLLKDFCYETLYAGGWKHLVFEANPFSQNSGLSDFSTYIKKSERHFLGEYSMSIHFFCKINGYSCPINVEGRTISIDFPDKEVPEKFSENMSYEIEQISRGRLRPEYYTRLYEEIDIEQFTIFTKEVIDKIRNKLKETKESEEDYIPILKKITQSLGEEMGE